MGGKNPPFPLTLVPAVSVLRQQIFALPQQLLPGPLQLLSLPPHHHDLLHQLLSWRRQDASVQLKNLHGAGPWLPGGGLRFFWKPGEAAAVGGLEQGETHLKGRPGTAAHSVTWTHVINIKNMSLHPGRLSGNTPYSSVLGRGTLE